MPGREKVFRLLINDDGVTAFPTLTNCPYLGMQPVRLRHPGNEHKAVTLRLTRWLQFRPTGTQWPGGQIQSERLFAA